MAATWADPTTTWSTTLWAWDGTSLGAAPVVPPAAVGSANHPGPLHPEPLTPITVNAVASAHLGTLQAHAVARVTVRVEDELLVLGAI
jgi:hypothetical protein